MPKIRFREPADRERGPANEKEPTEVGTFFFAGALGPRAAGSIRA
jgi:hypothetical protein